MNPCYILPAVLLLASCASQREPLEVRQFQLRDQAPVGTDDPMVRMEKERHLRGAVSMAERRERLGQYYTLLWEDASTDAGEVEVLFQYQQGATGSRVKRLVSQFPANATEGRVEFAVIGDDYFKNGKVLAWKATLLRGKQIIATKQSYLWQ